MLLYAKREMYLPIEREESRRVTIATEVNVGQEGNGEDDVEGVQV